MAPRKKTTKRKAQIDHSGGERDHAPTWFVLGPIKWIKKKGKRRGKPTVTTKEVKAYLRKAIAQL